MKKLFKVIAVILTVCMLCTSVSAATGSPTPGSPTPGSPTPGSPTPGSPTPGSPTPGSPTPGSPTPGSPTPSPGTDPGTNDEVKWDRIQDASIAESAYAASGLDATWTATEILKAYYKESGSITLAQDYINTVSNLNIPDNSEIVVYHLVDGSWKLANASLVSPGTVSFNIPKEDGLGYFVIFAKVGTVSSYSLKSRDTSKGIVDEENGLLIVKNFREFSDKTSTQENFNNIFAVEGATARFSGNLVSTKSSVVYTEDNGNTHTYRVIVLADVNCDGRVTAQDYIAIRNHIMETSKVTDSYQVIAADVNEGGTINAQDYVAIRNYIMSLD